jgi:heme A synthase
MTESLLGSEMFWDSTDWVRMMARLGVNLVFMSVIVGFVFFRLYRNREHVFTLFIFNIITFSMCMLLRKVPVDLGFALGLFAVFGILRYRTEPVRTKDLTYMFIVIGLGIINGIANKKISGAELLTVNFVITATAFTIELWPRSRRERWVPMLYDNLALLHAGKRDALIADMVQRTGLAVTRVELVRFDLVRDSAEVVVYYEQQPGQVELSSRLTES